MPFFPLHYSHVLIVPMLVVWAVIVSGPRALLALAWAAWAVGALIAVNDLISLIAVRSYPGNTYFQFEALITAMIVWPVAVSLVAVLRLRRNSGPSGEAVMSRRTRSALMVLFPLLLVGALLALNAFLSTLGTLFVGAE